MQYDYMYINLFSFGLTITNDIDIIVVVAGIDAPAGEAALSKVCLVALTVDLREPHHSRAIAIR